MESAILGECLVIVGLGMSPDLRWLVGWMTLAWCNLRVRKWAAKLEPDASADDVVKGTVTLLATRSAISGGAVGRAEADHQIGCRSDSDATDTRGSRSRGGRIERRQGLRGTVEAPLALEGPALVGDGDDRRPGRRPQARAADDLPRPQAGVGRGLVDLDAGVRVAVEGDVGRDSACRSPGWLADRPGSGTNWLKPPPLSHQAVSERYCPEPSAYERRPADRQHVGRDRRPVRYRRPARCRRWRRRT